MPTARSGTEISCQSALYRSGGGLCPGKGGLSGGSLFGGGGSVSRRIPVQGSLSRGVSIQGDLCPVGISVRENTSPCEQIDRQVQKQNLAPNFICGQ